MTLKTSEFFGTISKVPHTLVNDLVVDYLNIKAKIYDVCNILNVERLLSISIDDSLPIRNSHYYYDVHDLVSSKDTLLKRVDLKRLCLLSYYNEKTNPSNSSQLDQLIDLTLTPEQLILVPQTIIKSGLLLKELNQENYRFIMILQDYVESDLEYFKITFPTAFQNITSIPLNFYHDYSHKSKFFNLELKDA